MRKSAKNKSNTLNVQINFQNKIITGKVSVPKKTEAGSPTKKKQTESPKKVKPDVPKFNETPKKVKKVKKVISNITSPGQQTSQRVAILDESNSDLPTNIELENRFLSYQVRALQDQLKIPAKDSIFSDIMSNDQNTEIQNLKNQLRCAYDVIEK